MAAQTQDLGTAVLKTLTDTLRRTKAQAEKAFGQLDDDEFFYCLDADTNSVLVTIKHIAGNMQSRWTGFLTVDGEKPDRNRNGEFVEDREPRDRMLQRWQAGWATLFDTLAGLTPDDLLKTVRIRGEPMTALEAIVGQLSHYAYHTGHIVTICKHVRGTRWVHMSTPRGQSKPYRPAVP